MMSLEFFSLV